MSTNNVKKTLLFEKYYQFIQKKVSEIIKGDALILPAYQEKKRQGIRQRFLYSSLLPPDDYISVKFVSSMFLYYSIYL